MRTSFADQSSALRRIATVAASALTLGVVGAGLAAPAFADTQPTVTAPTRVYPVVNTPMTFSGSDPISGEARSIVAANYAAPAACNDAKANDYKPDGCPRVQMDLNTGAAGLIEIPGIVTKTDSPDGLDHLVSPDGAVITNMSNTEAPSQLINFNGTATQITNTLKTLKFDPATDYQERTLTPGSLPKLHTVVVNGDGGLQAATDTYIKVEKANGSPTLTPIVTPVTATVSQQADYLDDNKVTDPEMCTATICGLPFTNSQPIANSGASMLFVAWLDPSCGKFNLLGSAFPDYGTASNSNVDNLLKNALLDENQDNGYNSAQRTAIEASLATTPLGVVANGLDLSAETGAANQDTTVFGGISTLDEVEYAVQHVEYTPPATAMTCHLYMVVNDLGNNGTPASYDPTAVPTYEVPVSGTSAAQMTFDVKDTHPHVTVEQSAPGAPGVDPTHVSANYTVTFDQAVDTFDSTDISTTGSDAGMAISCLTVPVTPNTVYSLSCTAANDGTIKVSVPAGKVYANGHTGESSYANADSTSSDNSITWDATAPDETIDIDTADGQTTPTSTSPIKYTVVFSEKTSATIPGTFDGNDIDLSTSTAGGTLVASVSAPDPAHLNTYTVSVTGMTTAGNVIATVKPSVVTDQALNPNNASTSTGGDNVIAWSGADTTVPTVTINQAGAQADPTSTAPISFTVVFSEPVFGFAASGVTLSGTAGGTLVPTLASGADGDSTYTITVAGMTTSGTVIADIPANAAHDAAANANTAATFTDHTVTWTQVVDNTPPTVTINQAAAQADPTSTSPISFTVIFSEPVFGFTAGDVAITGTAGGGPTPTLAAGADGDSTYTITVAGMTTSGTVIADIPNGAAHDAASNLSTAATFTDHTVTWTQVVDNTPPTVTINQAAAQADPTSTSPISFTVVFSEPVFGFTAGDVAITGTAGGGPTPTLAAGADGDSTYTITVAGMTTSGTVIADIPANAAHDAAANANTAATFTDHTVTWTQVVDNTPPTVTINQAAAQADPTSTSPISYTVVFSEPVFGFTAGDVAITGTAGGSPSPTLAAGADGDSTYTITVAGMTTSGTVIADIPNGAAHDAASNLSTAATFTDHTVTWSPAAPPAKTTPTVAVTATPAGGATSGQTITITATVAGSGAAPTGTIAFTVGGASISAACDAAPLSTASGVTTATCTVGARPVGTNVFGASYAGDANYNNANGSLSYVVSKGPNPTITAAVTSAQPKSPAGWYRTAVTVTFTCTTHGSPLTAACPAPVVLSHNGAGQSVTRSIVATDGGAASVTVSPINIDVTKPTVRVTGAVSGNRYAKPGPKLTCKATDSLSGVKSCVIQKTVHGTTVSYTATATDKAGNTAKKSGHFTVVTYLITGATFHDGRYVVHAGHNYTVHAISSSTTAPEYLNAAPDGTPPAGGNYPLFSGGPGRWQIVITITPEMLVAGSWQVGVLVGGTVHLIPLHVIA